MKSTVLAADRSRKELEALRHAYYRLGSLNRRPALLVSTYFGEIGDALGVLAARAVSPRRGEPLARRSAIAYPSG
jgi:hypothetical protein